MGLDTLAADRGVAVSFSGPRQSKNSAKISPASVRTPVDIDASPGSLVGVYPHRAQVRSAAIRIRGAHLDPKQAADRTVILFLIQKQSPPVIRRYGFEIFRGKY
ncbi:hypothetical protein [Mesorhizobium sp. LNHC229A00]|uniref:hypothetical protein n=1 Tax=Mesorhizobium sp. LNHC229A00 TaxID=1287240 RepID=UPI0012EB7D19|nr:hypothetical protein [Mesorhizobium sp. LNHC229A00]